MHIDIVSLFPNIAAAPLRESILGKAQERGIFTLQSHHLRDWATDKHRTTDDTPYGGSQGMVIKCEPLFAAVESLRQAHQMRDPLSAPSLVLLLSPAGRPFNQSVAKELSRLSHIILLSGHYEGVDQRVIDHLIDGELSIGDYVLTNGAIAAAVVVDAVVRLLPGALGHAESASDDSHSTGLLEFPQYTRPVEFRGWRVPDILLSGHHAAIARWRADQSLAKTQRVRPDLLGIHPVPPSPPFIPKSVES
ncbi:MAG: tRNA (guanosine(37)-N1)-methyltransferase TrmD [Verrucomicrobiota bacterium]